MYIDYCSVSSHNLTYIDQATYLCIHTTKCRYIVVSMQGMGSQRQQFRTMVYGASRGFTT